MSSLGRDIKRVWLRQSSRSKEGHHLHPRLVQARPHVSDDKISLLVPERLTPNLTEVSVYAIPALRVWLVRLEFTVSAGETLESFSGSNQ
jgi:hypothetical protein